MAESAGKDGRRRPPPPPATSARRPATPPPIPQPKSPNANGASIAVKGGGDESVDGEPTRPVAAPDVASTVEEVIELLSSEAEALLLGGEDERLADLNVRLALINWDVLYDADACARYLELCEAHPLAPRLALQLALSENNAALLERAASALQDAPAAALPDGDNGAAMRDVAEAWLYRFKEPARAVDAARAGLGRGGAAADDLHAVLELAFAVGEDWRDLSDTLSERAVSQVKKRGAKANAAALRAAAEAAHLLDDRLGDPAAAAALIGQVLEAILPQKKTKKGGKADGKEELSSRWIAEQYLLARGIELAERTGDEALQPRRLIERRLQLLESVEGSGLEASATSYELARRLERDGDLDSAAALLTSLTAPAVADGAAAQWGPRAAGAAQCRVAMARGDWVEAASALCELADRQGAGPLRAVYERRAAELFDARAGDTGRSRDLWRKLVEADGEDAQAVRALERVLLAGETDPLLVYLDDQSRGADAGGRRIALRRAAAVAESRGGDVAMALHRRAAAQDGATDVAGLDDLARLHRRAGQRDELAELYLTLAGRAKDPRSASALRCASGALRLARGDAAAAEQAFTEAAKATPKDPMSRAALALLYRRAKRWKDLVGVLAELVKLTVNEATRLKLLRELGHVTALELHDPRSALPHLEAALELDPDDVRTLHALAQLYDEVGGWTKSVELRERAADVVDDPAQRVALLCEVGAIHRDRRSDDAAALQAFERALDTDATHVGALAAVAALHRRHGRAGDLFDTLRRELEQINDPSRELAVRLELAATAEQVSGEDPIAEYQAALKLQPGHEGALAGLEKLARAEQKWDVLATAFTAAPKTPRNLAVLAEAHERRGAWAELVATRREQLGHTDDPKERARLAAAAARIAETELSDADAAIKLYQVALTADPSIELVQHELARLLEQNGRWPELAGALERELAAIPAGDKARQKALLMRLGELRRDKLNKAGDAALSFEAVLEIAPGDLPTLAALEALYEQLGRDKDLLRVLEGRADAVADENVRAELFGRVASVKESRGDVDGAVTAYMRSFKADPTNRATFTAMEKLAYQHERWTDVMALYDEAIELVEGGGSRAYRLGDLYARRGQVQLQYLAQPGEAAASYLRVVELDPDNDTAVKFLESIFSQQGDWPGLINAYETRAQLANDDERRLETLRRAARVAAAKLKDPAEAARLYELILAIDGGDQEALDALERFHERAQDWDKLVGVLKSRLTSAPAGDDAVGMLKRIAQICEEGLRDEARAIENYLRILEIAPGNKEALDALGRIYESTEQWSEFIDVTRRQIRVTTDRNMKALLYFKCGSVMEAKFGKEEDAIRYYDAAIKTSPSCLPAVHGLRDLYRRREDWPRVIQTLELEVKLWQDDKERAGVFAQIGSIYSQRLGQPDRALHYFESALAVDPECLPANRALFEQYYKAGDWERAQPLAQALAQKAMREGDPSQRSGFYLKRGVVAKHTGDMRGAAESMIIALEIKPDNLDALDELGALAREAPEAYDFPATYRELEKLYKKRDDSAAYQARVLVAQAVMKERDGDLDAAENLYREAMDKARGDFTIMSALVELHANMRRWEHATDAIRQFLESDPPPDETVRVRALLRLAEIHADGEMDAHRAAAVLREVIRIQPSHQDAHYLLAQEMYLLGRYGEAEASVNRCIELAAAPGADISPQKLARYYYYLGRIKEAGGDARSAASQFRRAAEYDPGYAPPALALAKRSVEVGNQAQAESTLINAAHSAMEQRGAEAAVPLQRGLARILLASGDRAAAIEAYRGILAVEHDGAEDRVALAEIYAMEDVPKAIQELSRVLDGDLRHAPAYRMLSQLYSRVGDGDRAVRVLSIMDLLGYAEEQDKGTLAQLKTGLVHHPLRGHLEEEMRNRFLLPDAASSPVGQVFSALAAEITALFPQPHMGENLSPIQSIDDPPLKVAISDSARLFGVEPEVYVGENVPGAMAITSSPRRIVVFDRDLLTESDAARRFLLGRAFESIRGNYSILLHMTGRERLELSTLLASLLLPETEQMPPTKEFLATVPKRALRVIERFRGRATERDAETWFDSMMSSANRAGLFACDEFPAAVRMLSRLAGESMAITSDGALALGAIMGGEDLVRFFLEDNYQRMRDALASAPPQPAAQA